MANELWCEVLVLGPDSATVTAHRLEGSGAPDLGAVDEVARLALRAGRLGGRIVLSDVSPALAALLELSGLCVQMKGQSECRKESVGIEGVQEELHPGDRAG
jgi:hypothetical protein